MMKKVWMVFFKGDKPFKFLLKKFRKIDKKLYNLVTSSSSSVDKEKSLPMVKRTSKKFDKVDPIRFARELGYTDGIDLLSIKRLTVSEIIFESNVSFGGLKEGKYFFVNKKGKEVSFFPASEVK